MEVFRQTAVIANAEKNIKLQNMIKGIFYLLFVYLCIENVYPQSNNCISGNCYNGFGKCKYNNIVYEGNFKYGKRNGEGRISIYGNIFSGIWLNDKLFINGKYYDIDDLILESSITNFAKHISTSNSETSNEWSDWASLNCYKNLKFRIKSSSVGYNRFNWTIEFKNEYADDLYFNFILAEKTKKNNLSGACKVHCLKPNNIWSNVNEKTYKCEFIQTTGIYKIEDMVVNIFNLSMGYNHFSCSPPKFYSECITDTLNKEMKKLIFNNKLSGKWLCYKYKKDWNIDGKIFSDEEDCEKSNFTLNIEYYTDYINVIAPSSFLTSTLNKVSNNTFYTENINNEAVVKLTLTIIDETKIIYTHEVYSTGINTQGKNQLKNIYFFKK